MRRALWPLCAWLAGCGASGDPGLVAWMRVANAQFVPGASPAPEDGPALASLNNSSGLVRPGQLSKPLSGTASKDTRAVALFLDGDAGYWLLNPGAPDLSSLGELSWSASLSFSPFLPPGTHTLAARAVDVAGRFGAARTATLTTGDVALGATLVVALTWDVNADLDLHVTDPSGTDIWAKNINSHAPMSGVQDPDAWRQGGILDLDSNANCVIDGLRTERVYWTVAPPSGHYVVRVDTASMCAQPIAVWRVSVTRDGNPSAQANGLARDSDSWFPHQSGSGQLALQFDIP